jgi:hypothetical protein
LAGSQERKRLLGRPRLWWDNSIKIDVREIELNFVDWINLDQNKDQWRALVRLTNCMDIKALRL